jgi:hypothetical protein
MKRSRFDLPKVPGPYQAALEAAVDAAFALTDPDAVVVGGSIVEAGRGGPPPDPGSDFDIYVLHDPAWRQRIQRRCAGVPCEFFINPALQVRRYFAEEALLGRPVSAQIFSSGSIVYDPLGRAAALATEARSLLSSGWHPSQEELTQRRYLAASLFEDVRESVVRDPLSAELLLGQALNAVVEYAFAARGVWLPRAKERGRRFAEGDPPAGWLLEACSRGADLSERLRSAERLAERILGEKGFFEWVGPRLPAASTGL